LNGYLVLVDGDRYVAQAETAALAEQRVREAVGSGAQRVDAARQLTPDEVAVLILTPAEVRREPAEHG
jgi:hypothetical protein